MSRKLRRAPSLPQGGGSDDLAGARVNTGTGVLPNGQPVGMNNCPFCTAANVSAPKLTSSQAARIAGMTEGPLSVGLTGELFRRLGLGNGVPQGTYGSEHSSLTPNALAWGDSFRGERSRATERGTSLAFSTLTKDGAQKLAEEWLFRQSFEEPMKISSGPHGGSSPLLRTTAF